MVLFAEKLCRSEAETEAFAQDFAKYLNLGMAIGLKGDLGAGKTFFTNVLCKALGYKGETHSPSYALIHEYPGPLLIYHADLYRLPFGADWEEIGIADYFNEQGVLLIEWPERLPNAQDLCNYWVEIEIVSESERYFKIFKRE